MGFAATRKLHSWQPGEKEVFSTKNDILSLERSLAVLRRRNPGVPRWRARLIRWLGGTVGNPSERREIARLEGLLNARRADLVRAESVCAGGPRTRQEHEIRDVDARMSGRPIEEIIAELRDAGYEVEGTDDGYTVK